MYILYEPCSSSSITDDDFLITRFQAVKTDNKLLFEHKSKFLLVHSSSGFKHSLKEVSKQHLITAFSRIFLRFYKILQSRQN